MIKLLLQAKSPIDHSNDEGMSALFLAVLYHDEKIVSILLEAHCHVNSTDRAGNTPLLLAVAKGQLEVVKRLVNAHASIEQANHDGVTPLVVAVQKGNLEILQFLLSVNANLSQPTKTPQQPLPNDYDDSAKNKVRQRGERSALLPRIEQKRPVLTTTTTTTSTTATTTTTTSTLSPFHTSPLSQPISLTSVKPETTENLSASPNPSAPLFAAEKKTKPEKEEITKKTNTPSSYE